MLHPARHRGGRLSRKRADVLLVERGLFDSRAKARAAIEAGGVSIGGRVIGKPSEMIDEAAVIAAEPAHPWVGRGGIKLDHALTLWPVAVEGRTVLDVGASTGGFTQVCLARGAARVYAVDVGHGQLHPKVAADERVVSLEGLDARVLTAAQVPEPIGLIVCDVSFIGLEKALPAALALAAPNAALICLVKPQFQAGREADIREEGIRAKALTGVAAWLEGQGWTIAATAPSPITGADGNAEYLLWAKK